jgi:hypothetical protein
VLTLEEVYQLLAKSLFWFLPFPPTYLTEWPCFVFRRSEFVGIGKVTGWTNEESWFDSRYRQESFLRGVQTGSGSYPASYPMGTGGSLPCGKRPGREAIKNALRNSSSSLYVFKSWYLIKYRDNFAYSLLGQRWNIS